MSNAPTQWAIEAVWRIESPRLSGALVRLAGSLDRAEDLAHEVLVAALETWPETGIPERPGAWLMTTARRRGLDGLRRDRMQGRKHAALDIDADRRVQAQPLEVNVGDDLLRSGPPA